MDRVQIEKELRQIIVRVLNAGLEPEDIPCGPGLLEQLHIDSLIALQIIVQIEQQFNITIDDDAFAIDMLDTLDKVVTYIERQSARADAGK